LTPDYESILGQIFQLYSVCYKSEQNKAKLWRWP